MYRILSGWASLAGHNGYPGPERGRDDWRTLRDLNRMEIHVCFLSVYMQCQGALGA